MVLGLGQAAIDLQTLALGTDVAGGDKTGSAEVDIGFGDRRFFLVFQPSDGGGEQLAVKLITDRADVAGLLGAEDISRPANFQIAHGDSEAGAEFGIFFNRPKPAFGDGGNGPIVGTNRYA